MKSILIVLTLMFPSICFSQFITFSSALTPERNAQWDSAKFISICGLDAYCFIPEFHWIDRNKPYQEPDGYPIYGIQNSLIGVVTKYGFVATKRRDHLIGKPLDLELLSNAEKMYCYLKLIHVD